MAVDVFGYYVEVAAYNHGHILCLPSGHLVNQSVHPSQFVVEISASGRIAIGKINIDYSDAHDRGIQKSRMSVSLIARQCVADRLDGKSREYRNAVIRLLRNRYALIADLFERGSWKFRPLQLLQQQHVGFSRLQPCGDVTKPSANGVDVPTGDSQDDLSTLSDNILSKKFSKRRFSFKAVLDYFLQSPD